MVIPFKAKLLKLQLLLKPKIELILARWRMLQPRERQLLGGLGILLVFMLLFMMINRLKAYKGDLDVAVQGLNSFVAFSKEAAANYKIIQNVEANSFNAVSTEQIKGDITQVLQVKEPDILIQDGQMTINVPNAQFNQVMTLLDQLRRSYAIFPSQLTITRQSRAGFVSFNATFWVKQ